MIEFTVEADAVIARVDDKIKDLAKLASEEDTDSVAGEMVAWQTDDMNRQYPNLERPNPWYNTTLIWPRSRVAMRERRRYRGRVGSGRRPILREELLEMLHKRMVDLLARMGAWK